MQYKFSYSEKNVMYLFKSLVSKIIERWDYKRYVLFVDSYSEMNFLKISAFFCLKNVDNEEPFWAGFHTVAYQQQEIILRLTKIFSNLALLIFRKCVINGMINLKYKILLSLFWDKVSLYLNLSSVGVGEVPFLRKITEFEDIPFVDYLPFVVHIPVDCYLSLLP